MHLTVYSVWGRISAMQSVFRKEVGETVLAVLNHRVTKVAKDLQDDQVQPLKGQVLAQLK